MGDDSRSDGPGPGIMAYAGLGMLCAACLLVGLGVGFVVDEQLHTLPLFMFVGLVVGIGLSAVSARAALRRF